jgi:hypothetical protein
MSKSAYTPEMIQALEAREGAWNLDAAKEFAADHGLTARSVIAKISSLRLPYAKQERVTKNGEPVVGKASLVSEIEKAFDIEISSAVKMTKADLRVLVAAVVVEDEADSYEG